MRRTVRATKARLRRLVSSGLCEADNAERYAGELRRFGKKLEDDTRFKSRERFLKAMADSTRLKMIRLLSEREMCVCEIMVALEITQPTASHHLNILERRGIAVKRRKGKWVLYRLSSPKMTAVAAMLDNVGASTEDDEIRMPSGLR
jgi:ArsR family transcriptional regulator